jgi:hypothetical protein
VLLLAAKTSSTLCYTIENVFNSCIFRRHQFGFGTVQLSKMKSGHGATRVKHMRRDTKRRKSFFRRTYQSETAVPVSISCTQPRGHLSISSRIWYTINNLETKQACVLAQSKHFSIGLLELDLENGKCKVASLAVSNVLTSNMHSNSLAIIFIHNSIVVLILIEKKKQWLQSNLETNLCCARTKCHRQKHE